MFFEIHNENRIGYKSLTDADLGRAPKSHQTHIGLFDDVLTFLPNKIEIEDAMFIYNGQCTVVPLSFDRIERASGRFDAPKIKTGGVKAVTVVSAIKDYAKQLSTDTKWFLFWFGLKSEQPVFFLFNSHSQEFKDILSMGIELSDKVKGRMESCDDVFSKLVEYLENIINKSGESILRDLEVASQTEPHKSMVKLRRYDIKRANEVFESIGRRGEELVNKYLLDKLDKGEIQNFVWVNKSSESAYPYDFTIQNLQGNIIYLDVKATSFTFDQKMIFSDKEIKFISRLPNEYHIYRIFGITEDSLKMRICEDCKNFMNNICEVINAFESGLIPFSTDLKVAKLAVPPVEAQLKFSSEIIFN